MDRKEKANAYHDSGYNCCQAVSAAFADVTGMSEAQALAVGGGFGGGLRCGEICGAVSGAVMVLSLTHPYNDCTNLERKNEIAGLPFQAAKAAGVMKKCPVFITTAVEIVEQMLAEEKNTEK